MTLRRSLKILLISFAVWLASFAVALAINLGVTADLDSMLLLHMAASLRELKWPVAAAHAASFVGGYLVRLPVAAVAAVFLLRRNDRVAAIVVAISTLGTFFGAALLQQTVDRARPDIIEPLVHYTTGSFPSGHAASAVAAFGAMGWAALRHGARASLVWTVVICLAFTIGLSRLVLGAHWPTDVVAGWLMGLGSLLICVSGATSRSALPGLDPTFDRVSG